MPRKKVDVIIGGYSFFLAASRITVNSRGNKDDEELKAIAKLYEDHYVATRRGGILPKGKWQWCFNSKGCRKAVYAPLCDVEKTEGRIFCSHTCANRVPPPEKIPPPGIVESVKPVSIVPSNPGKAVEQRDDSEKVTWNWFQCLECKAIKDEIHGNPGFCSSCGDTRVFIVVEAPAR